MDIFDFWALPEYDPNKNQIEALLWLQDNIDKKYLIIEAPTGVGKSALGVTFAKYYDWVQSGKNNNPNKQTLGSSFILTPQKIHQEQYENGFMNNNSMASLYGKVNYRCESHNTNCDVGSKINSKPCNNCPHKIATDDAARSKITVMNYKLALMHFFKLQKVGRVKFEPRKLMVLDECHNIEDTLTEFDSVSMNKINFKQLTGMTWNQLQTPEEIHEWMPDYLDGIRSEMDRLQPLYDALKKQSQGYVTPDDIQMLRNYEELNNQLPLVEYIANSSFDHITHNYVIVHNSLMRQYKAKYAAHTFHQSLENFAEKFLFMSATIPNIDQFARDLDLDESNVATLKLKSEFKPENRPVYFMPTMNMKYGWDNSDNKENRKKLVNTLDEILTLHGCESGIIHTANFKISEWVVDKLRKNKTHRILHHNPDSNKDRNEVINMFMNSKEPTVLVSPSITEGLDLKYDKGRFAVFVKVPYSPLTDQWIKVRKKENEGWYTRRAVTQIIQGCGRVVRTIDDSGTTYILDQGFYGLFKYNNSLFPEWWQNALEQC